MSQKMLTNYLASGRDKPTRNLGDFGSRSGNCGAGCGDCGDSISCFNTELDAKFERQWMTPQGIFVPRLNEDQKCWANAQTEFPATAWFMHIPHEHRLVDVAVRIEPDTLSKPTDPCDFTRHSCDNRPNCCKVSPAGVTFDIVGQTFDTTTMEPVDEVAVIPGLGGLSLDAYKFVPPVDHDIKTATCRSYLIGIRFLSGPTEKDREGNTALGCIPSRIGIIAGAREYETMIRMG